METVINDFVAARDRYLALEKARIRPRTPEQRERFHIELMEAWLKLQHSAQAVAGLRSAEGMQFARVN